MARKRRNKISSSLRAQNQRDRKIRVGLTVVVVLFAVAVVAYIVVPYNKPAAGEVKSIRVTAARSISTEGAQPKAVVSVFEDFLCPHCGTFERNFGHTISRLIDTGVVAMEYTLVAIFDSPENRDYSSRAANAAYCVADQSVEAFRRFRGTLFVQQPSESGGSYPDDAQLIETARRIGADSSEVSNCISRGTYIEMVKGLAQAANITATPTVEVNGQDFEPTTPQGLVDRIKQIVGDVPGLDGAGSALPPG